jgi:hypothetical protein
MINSLTTKSLIPILIIIVLFSSEIGYAQLAVPFKVRYQSHVKGDMTVIANGIVNRKESRSTTSEPYNELSEKAKLNDEFEMAYIDIDNDETTFSSSSAELNLDTSSSKKVIYAGLYWAASYKYESGTRDKKWNYTAINADRGVVNEIKLKLPGGSAYLDLKGEVLYDGLNQKNFKESAPYAVYADVTKHIQALSNPNGQYVVANIKATQGIISGGVAGGWTLFVVYEDASATEKFITSFDGFVGITTRPIEILYNGFMTLPEGRVNAKLACAALEGDYNLTGDQLEIKSGESLKYSLLSHPLKPADNFFNSTIVVNEDYYSARNPNSLNTLGYDTCLLSVENQDNLVIQNNTNKVSLKLKSSGDRYSMFFNAFNVEVRDPLEKIEGAEIINDEPKEIKLTSDLDINTKKESKAIIEKKEEGKLETAIPEKKLVNTKTTDRPEKIYNSIMDMIRESEQKNAATLKTGNNKRKTVLPGADVIIPRQQKGYYVVANVFAVPNNTTRFVSKLKKEGLQPQVLYNPNTNYKSVYIAHFLNWSDALDFYYSNADGLYFDDLWIMLVNTSSGSIL